MITAELLTTWQTLEKLGIELLEELGKKNWTNLAAEWSQQLSGMQDRLLESMMSLSLSENWTAWITTLQEAGKWIARQMLRPELPDLKPIFEKINILLQNILQWMDMKNFSPLLQTLFSF